MTTTCFDTAKAEAFSYKLLNILNNGATSLMVSIGHRTGLFDTMSKLEYSTSEEIAAAADLDERYVREWLGAMVVGEIVEIDPHGPTYHLRAEHAASLTRDAGADNMALFAQYIPVLGAVEDRIVECFHKGGGVSYDEFGRFHEVMAEDSGQSVLSSLEDSILPLIPDVIEQLEEGVEVLDVGCGSGLALIKLAELYPNSRFTGYDLSKEAIGRGKEVALSKGLSNVSLEECDLTHFGWDRKFDFITAFDAIHDQAKPDNVLAGIHSALQPGGTFLMQDIAGSCHHHKNMEHPLGPILYTISTMHCMTVSLAQGGAGLGAMWGEETARAMLRDAGFTSIETKKLPHDMQNNYYVVRK